MKRLKTSPPSFPHVNGATAREVAVPEVPEIVQAPPTPGEVALPTSFEGYVELAKRVSRGAMTDKAQLWATLALAAAADRQADLLEELIALFDVEEAEPDEVELPSRFSEAIADGITLAVSGIVAGSEDVQAIVAKLGQK